MTMGALPCAVYILVRNHSEGFELLAKLKGEGIRARIAPAPHGVRACCGMSLVLADREQAGRVRSFLEDVKFPVEGIVEVENAFDPNRGRFC